MREGEGNVPSALDDASPCLQTTLSIRCSLPHTGPRTTSRHSTAQLEKVHTAPFPRQPPPPPHIHTPTPTHTCTTRACPPPPRVHLKSTVSDSMPEVPEEVMVWALALFVDAIIHDVSVESVALTPDVVDASPNPKNQAFMTCTELSTSATGGITGFAMTLLVLGSAEVGGGGECKGASEQGEGGGWMRGHRKGVSGAPRTRKKTRRNQGPRSQGGGGGGWRCKCPPPLPHLSSTKGPSHMRYTSMSCK